MEETNYKQKHISVMQYRREVLELVWIINITYFQSCSSKYGDA